jgi:predicted DNA-binding transcriptional regulator YafY
MSRRANSLIRVLKLLRILARPRTVAFLARTLEVTPRTVWRDLRVLEEAGFDVLIHQPIGKPATYRVRRKI